MEFDYILACGDSFTEGCQNIIGKGPEGTWPGVLAKHYGVPFDNIALGGSSNTIISLQPANEAYAIEHLKNAKKPLIIFGFTMHSRLTYFNLQQGRVTSHFSIDPDHMDNYDPMVTAHKDHVHHFLRKQFPNDLDEWGNFQNMRFTGMTPKDSNWLDGFSHATRKAIYIAMGWKNLIPNATILWGFIHTACEHQGFGKDIHHIINSFDNGIEEGIINYPHEEACFNKHNDWQPFDRALGLNNQDGGYIPNNICMDKIIGPRPDGTIDMHPNEQGIELLANMFIDEIEIRRYKSQK